MSIFCKWMRYSFNQQRHSAYSFPNLFRFVFDEGMFGIGRVILGAAALATAGGLGFTVYMSKHGCCGLFSELCGLKDKFDETKERVEALSNEIDDRFTEGS